MIRIKKDDARTELETDSVLEYIEKSIGMVGAYDQNGRNETS